MAQESPLIRTSKLTKIFVRGSETITALRDIDIVIPSGEFVAISGASGSGKSTLMYILGLIDRQTSGTYWLSGDQTDHLSDNERARLRNQSLGFVFQSFHLLPRATALRNVAMPLVYSASYDRSYSEARMLQLAEEALVQVGLADRMNHLPNELSGGQRQRVAIARALVNKPRLLFADEPTGNLDSRKGSEILELLTDLNDSGMTVVLVTHDPAIARSARRRITMRDGSIVEDSHALS